MGKYEVLGHFLRNSNTDTLELSFDEIENILGFPLPKSAYKYQPWWANDENHVQARDGWMSAGYKSESVDVIRHRINFQKINDTKVIRDDQHTLLKEFNPRTFERHAQHHMSQFFKKKLTPRKKEYWPKLFDMVSEDYDVVGDAKFLSMVRDKYIPSAKLSVISEHVWMLEKINSSVKFLVFGNDENVPKIWLKRYGSFVDSINFYYLNEKGNIIILK
jgi:hypothetical protein